MPRITANEVELHYDRQGSGEPLVLVHGNWSDRENWLAVLPALARVFDVVNVDRRGHGRSERGAEGTRREQEDDLAALIEGLGFGSANVIGTSFGGSIALGLAARRPDLVRAVIAHEPPLISLVADEPSLQPALAGVQVKMEAILGRIERGDATEAARQFVDEVAFVPGMWEQLPGPLRATMIDTAPAMLADQSDPAWADLESAARATGPVLLTQGDLSPAWFRAIVAELARSIGHAQIHTFHGAGHAPHLSHPDDFVDAVTGFLARSGQVREAGAPA